MNSPRNIIFLIFLAPFVLIGGYAGKSVAKWLLSPSPQPTTGSVQLTASPRLAYQAKDYPRVTVTVSAAEMPAITQELVPQYGAWAGTLDNLPAGKNLFLWVQAFDALGTPRYEGREALTLVAGQQTRLDIELGIVLTPEQQKRLFGQPNP